MGQHPIMLQKNYMGVQVRMECRHLKRFVEVVWVTPAVQKKVTRRVEDAGSMLYGGCQLARVFQVLSLPSVMRWLQLSTGSNPVTSTKFNDCKQAIAGSDCQPDTIPNGTFVYLFAVIR